MRTACLVLLLIALPSLPSCAAGVRNRDAVTLTGTVRVVGNEPFAHVVLTVPDAAEKSGAVDHLLTGPLLEELQRHHQGERVALEGVPCTVPARQTLTHCFRPSKITIMNRQ